MPDSTDDTMEHIGKVQTRIREMCGNLLQRLAVHDASKLVEPEKSGFDVLSAQLSTLVYGSDEYRAALAPGEPGLETLADLRYNSQGHAEYVCPACGVRLEVRERVETIYTVQVK